MCLHLAPTQMPPRGKQHPKILVRAPLGSVFMGSVFISLWALFPTSPALAVPSKAHEPAAPQVRGASPLWLSPPFNAMAATGMGQNFGRITLGAVRLDVVGYLVSGRRHVLSLLFQLPTKQRWDLLWLAARALTGWSDRGCLISLWK